VYYYNGIKCRVVSLKQHLQFTVVDIIIIIILSSFGIYGAAVVPDSGVGDTIQVAYSHIISHTCGPRYHMIHDNIYKYRIGQKL